MAPLELMEHVPIPAYVFRVEGSEFVLEEVNAAARVQNPALVSLRGKPMAGLYRDQPQVIEDARRCATERTTVVREIAVRRYDRTEATQYVRLTYVPVPPSHMVVFMQDIATPHTAAEALRESEARYRSLVASLPVGILLRGAGGRVLACNDVAVQLFGARSEADLLGETEVLAPDRRVQTESGEPVGPGDLPGYRAATTGQAELGRVYALRIGDALRWVRVSAQPILSSAGSVSGSVTTLTDITDRVSADRAQREVAARLELALAAARMGMWEYTPATDFGWWSDNLDDIFNFATRPKTLDEFIAHVHPDDAPEFVEKASHVLSGADGNSFEHEFRIVGSDRNTRWARVRGRLWLESGRTYVAGTLMDVTEYHRLEEELRRASRLESIGRLAGGIAHDFNNLLAAMMGSLALVERRATDDMREDLATIRHGALRARDLTRQLLAFARKQPVAFEVVDLSALVRTVERLLERLVGPRIQLVITSAASVFVHADASLLEQVLVNLVVNAREAMADGGRLDVRVGRMWTAAGPAEPARDRALLEVCDSGVGMDEETRRQVFDPFFTTKAHGTGLGLASSYGIVKQHGGDIVVESAPGCGTCFRVLLPWVPEPEQNGEHPSVVQPSRAVRRRRVLVVDDQELVRKTSVRMLQSLGCEVLSAANAAEAVEQSAGCPGTIDVLLCDVTMPGRDGPSVAAELQARRPGLKVIFVSGYSDAVQTAALANATFLQKPYSMEELIAKLHELERD